MSTACIAKEPQRGPCENHTRTSFREFLPSRMAFWEPGGERGPGSTAGQPARPAAPSKEQEQEEGAERRSRPFWGRRSRRPSQAEANPKGALASTREGDVQHQEYRQTPALGLGQWQLIGIKPSSAYVPGDAATWRELKCSRQVSSKTGS